MVVWAGVGDLVVAMCALLRRAGSSPSLSAGLSWEKGERTRGGGSGKGGKGLATGPIPPMRRCALRAGVRWVSPGSGVQAVSGRDALYRSSTGFGPISGAGVLGSLRVF